MSRIIYLCVVLAIICSSALASSPLFTADEATITGIWESIDFGAGRYYRLEIRWPGLSLIVVDGTPQGADFVFVSDHCTINGGDLKCTAEERNSGIPMRISGHVVANSFSGRATLSLHASEGKENRLLNAWDEPSRTFWKEASLGSRLSDLVKAEEKAEKLAHDRDGGQMPPPKGVEQRAK